MMREYHVRFCEKFGVKLPLLTRLGPRGSGKTILLKQLLAKTEAGFYISIDSLDKDTNLFELILKLKEDYSYKVFFLDEIHFISDINKYLKLIFDNLDVSLFITSSISLQLIQSAHDLSRRIKLFQIDYFSFYEFLIFNKVATPSRLTIEEIVARKFSSEYSQTLPYFKKYITGGNVPISLETKDVKEALQRNLEKIVYSDIPKLKKLFTEELEIVMKAFKFISRASVGDLNPNVVAKNLKITRYKALQYIELLEKAYVLNLVFPAGTNITQEPKIHCKLPYRLLENDYQSCVGGLREDFAVECFLKAGFQIKYLKSKKGVKTADFLISKKGMESIVVEIGGAGKGYQQFKGIDKNYKKLVFADHFDLQKNTVPLALLGMIEKT